MKEDIKVLEEMLEREKECLHYDISQNEVQAIENLIEKYKNVKKSYILATKYKEEQYIPKSKVREKIEEIEKQGIWIDEDYYYNEELGEEYPICKKKFTKEELEEVVIDILNKLQEGDNNETKM